MFRDRDIVGIEPTLTIISFSKYLPIPYVLKKVENIGVEPMTSCVQGRRSSQLS